MESTKWAYFQFRKPYGYEIYLRFKESELNPKFTHVLTEMGFSALNDSEIKKVQLHLISTKLLTVQEANPRLEQIISGPDSLDKYGSESLSLQNGTPLYTFRKVGIMAMPSTRSHWELAIHTSIAHTDQMVGFRVILVRFISQALADYGVISYWGTVKDDTVYMMKQANSFGEAVFIDFNKRMIFLNGGEVKIGSSVKIIRKDKAAHSRLPLSREDLIGFLSVSTCLLSFSGITSSMKKTIYDLSVITSASYAATEGQVNL